LRVFPASQSNSVTFDKSIKSVYYRNIHGVANGRGRWRLAADAAELLGRASDALTYRQRFSAGRGV
jgi:hypothetical protein